MIGEEWRPVVGFIAYEVTKSGRVRDKFNMRELISGNGNVTLNKGNRRYYRSVRKLVREAFDERDKPVLSVEGYRPIPQFPGYSVNREGAVYNERTRSFLTVDETQGTVKLYIDGVRYHRSVRQLVRSAFPEG